MIIKAHAAFIVGALWRIDKGRLGARWEFHCARQKCARPRVCTKINESSRPGGAESISFRGNFNSPRAGELCLVKVKLNVLVLGRRRQPTGHGPSATDKIRPRDSRENITVQIVLNTTSLTLGFSLVY